MTTTASTTIAASTDDGRGPETTNDDGDGSSGGDSNDDDDELAESAIADRAARAEPSGVGPPRSRPWKTRSCRRFPGPPAPEDAPMRAEPAVAAPGLTVVYDGACPFCTAYGAVREAAGGLWPRDSRRRPLGPPRRRGDRRGGGSISTAAWSVEMEGNVLPRTPGDARPEPADDTVGRLQPRRALALQVSPGGAPRLSGTRCRPQRDPAPASGEAGCADPRRRSGTRPALPACALTGPDRLAGTILGAPRPAASEEAPRSLGRRRARDQIDGPVGDGHSPGRWCWR